ncbi:MAG: penicillin-binding protein 1C [Kiritimatiellia bacterium]
MRAGRWIGRGLKILALWYLLAALLPFPDEKLREYPQNLRYEDGGGRMLRRSLGEGGMDADWLPLAAAGEWAGPALIAVEDQRFYQHHGVDPLAVLRAIAQNLSQGRVVSGASTLSTQVIRLVEPRPRHLGTKLIEAFRATQLELRYDKDFILEQYLNRAPFGGNRQGLATASRRYYGKEPSNLSAGEAALLMGLPQSPSRFRPDRAPEKAEMRRWTVLRRMQEEGMLTEIPLLDSGSRWVEPPLEAFHFTEWVRRRQGWQKGVLRTTLDLGLQNRCEEILSRWRERTAYADTDGVGVLLMDAQTGAVRVWVGSWDAEDPEHGQVDTVTRRRAPGSTLKPFAYALGMEQGWLTPATRLEDLPRSFQDYRPQNMDGAWRGEISARDALVQSLNMPALQVVERVGLQPFLGVLRASGMKLAKQTPEETGLGAVLGGGMEASLLELVQAYSVFSGEGKGVRARGVAAEHPEGEQIFSAGVSYWISEILSGPERDGMLYGHHGDVIRPDLAFKTGTSHGLRDAWSIGWNADWVLGVWVGRMDGAAVSGLSGSTHAAPLLGELAEQLLGPGNGEWPEAPRSVGTWRGRERVAGVTDLQQPESSKPDRRILNPDPAQEIQLLHQETLLLPLRALGDPEEPVHWFLNGVWQGACSPEESLLIRLERGRHEIRAVFADGQADSREIQIL